MNNPFPHDRRAMSPQPPFDYRAAFSRNIGWVTAEEQEVLRQQRAAIAGLGGVGGYHAVALARLGVGRFALADPDHFELQNFNRQMGATLPALGRPKLDVVAQMVGEVNPSAEIELFPDGVSPDNLPAFLRGADVYLDGLDYFAFAARRATFAACAELGVPAVTAAPLGMGAALLSFLPGGMTFEEYFRLEGQPEDEQALRFLIGLSPSMLQRAYLVDPAAVRLEQRQGPSTVMACHLCAGLAATEALKILLKRGRVLSAPWALQFDAYRGKLVRTWRPGGNRNPIQRIAIAIARAQLRRMREKAVTAPASTPR
jgi:molybdopterin/thiamine biosynthesis adenylyltransferase